jgi:hypothetical protein
MKAIPAIALLFIIVMGLDLPGFAQNRKASTGDIILGAGAGYTRYEGYYRGRFGGTYIVGASLLYGNTDIVKYLLGEFDINYARYPVKDSPGSYMHAVSVNLGPVFSYPVVPHFHIYTGLSAEGTYLNLHTSVTSLHSPLTDKNLKTLKPGLMARAGFFFPIRRGFRMRLGAEYSLLYLSGKPLQGLRFTGGLLYNFNIEERAGDAVAMEDPAVRIEWYLALAEKALRKGDAEGAVAHYQKMLALDRNNREAQEKLNEIKKASADYTLARRLAGENRYYEALPLLESAGKILAPAREEQEKIRKQLAGEAAALEKKGIALYEKGDYRGCITIMNRLLLIDPNNRTGLIYLPRAVKRHEALERLR